jgi:hypothetical protein
MSTAAPVLERPQSPDVPTTEQPAGRPRRGAALALGLLLLFDVAVPAVMAWKASLTVPTFHLDGAFQTASGMFRLADGGLPGRDFFPYLGIGPLYLLFPLFLLLGGDMAASVFAAHFVTLLVAGVVIATVVQLVRTRPSRWAFALAATVPFVVVLVTNQWPALGLVDPSCGGCIGAIRNATDPGFSLRPLRAFAPYLLALVVLAVLRTSWRTRTRMLVVGSAAGAVAALWSNDYGLVSGGLAVALVTVAVLFRITDRGTRRPRAIAGLWAAAAVAYVVSGLVATGGHFVPYLTYNLSDVRGDQFWYYAGWEEVYKIYSPGDLVRVMLSEGSVLSFVLLGLLFTAALWTRRLSLLLLGYVGISLLLGGTAATVGGHGGGYYWSFRLWGVVVAFAGAAAVAAASVRWIRARRPAPALPLPSAAVVRRVLGAVVAVAALVVGTLAVRDATDLRASLASDDRYVWDDGLGGYLDARFADHVGWAREQGRPVVEEYMGLAGVVNGPYSDLPVDSVIHALGRQRDAFADHMATLPEPVVTTAPGATMSEGAWIDDWASWNVSASWWFYRDLFRSYVPERTSPMTLVWTPADEPATWTSVPCRVSGYGIELDATANGFYEVNLDYRGPGDNARAFSMVRNRINAPGIGWLALDPGATSQSFPIYVQGGASFPLKDIAAGWGDPLTTLTGCTASAVSFPAGTDTMDLYSPMVLTSRALDYQATPADIDFGSWTGGVHEDKAAIAVPNTAKNRTAMREAASIRFSDGDVREVETVLPSKTWLVVFVSGDVLDPDVTAYPEPFVLER